MRTLSGCLAIRGPKILQESWDKHKTVKQKYVVARVCAQRILFYVHLEIVFGLSLFAQNV